MHSHLCPPAALSQDGDLRAESRLRLEAPDEPQALFGRHEPEPMLDLDGILGRRPVHRTQQPRPFPDAGHGHVDRGEWPAIGGRRVQGVLCRLDVSAGSRATGGDDGKKDDKRQEPFHVFMLARRISRGVRRGADQPCGFPPIPAPKSPMSPERL